MKQLNEMKYLSIFACLLSSVCCVDRLAAQAWAGAGASIWRGLLLWRIQIRKYQEYRPDIQDRSGRYGLVNGPGMDKKYDGNTLWSTFYCLEDVIHGVLRNNISIDIVMPTSQMQIFLPSKKGKSKY